jgi:hypothetical protein
MHYCGRQSTARAWSGTKAILLFDDNRGTERLELADRGMHLITLDGLGGQCQTNQVQRLQHQLGDGRAQRGAVWRYGAELRGRSIGGVDGRIEEWQQASLQMLE